MDISLQQPYYMQANTNSVPFRSFNTSFHVKVKCSFYISTLKSKLQYIVKDKYLVEIAHIILFCSVNC